MMWRTLQRAAPRLVSAHGATSPKLAVKVSTDRLEAILHLLAEGTAQLAQATEAGVWNAAHLALASRDDALVSLERALPTVTLTAPQLQLLDQLLQQGESATRSLIARRETTRAQIAELESLRRQLAAWIAAPAAPALDMSL